MQTLQVLTGASTFTHLAVYRPGKEFYMNKIDKIDRELEKAREKAAEWQAKIRELEKQKPEEGR